MYRIEVAPGEETVFRSMEELAVAIRNGVVTPRARIYHNASQKWLPIGLHPHYKKALELPAASSAHPRSPTPVPAKPRSKHRVESLAAQPYPEPQPAPAPKVPAPVVSPVVAMQQEVLRDLPVVEIPEPLPWARRPAPPAPEPPPPPEPVAPIAQAVQTQPTATLTYTPRAQPEPVQPEPVQPEPVQLAAEQPAPVQPEPVSPWPHLEPLEEAHTRPTARRSNRAGGRPLLLVGVATALVFVGHFVLRAAPSAADSADGANPEEVVSEPAESDPPVEKPVTRVAPPPAPAATPPRVTSSPARVLMTPGPAFAGSVAVRPGADTAAPRAKAPVPAATTAPADPAADPSIAPPPVELELPNLKTDSLAPARTSDTMGMKKILRALNGSRP
jgi:hypothetical protein